MSDTGFERFAEAVSARPKSAATTPALRLDRVTVLGGGSDALMLAALCLAEGAEVTLFSAYGAELDALRNSGGISLREAGPVGTYQVDRSDTPSIQTTAELDRAVADAQIIFLTGPVHKQRTYAMVLADHVRDGHVLVLAPGRSLGTAEAAWMLRVGGAKADFTLVEVQGLPYWAEVSGSIFSLSPAAGVRAATLPSGRNDVLEAVERFLPNIQPALSTVHSGFADGSGLVEVPALLMGGPAVGNGLPTVPDGGVALPENATFRTLIGREHEAVMGRMADERTRVARKFGVRDLPSLPEWLNIHAGAVKGKGHRPVPSRAQAAAMIRCATIGSLVPLASAAHVAGHSVPVTEAMIALASAVLGTDIANAGRRLETIGMDAGDLDDARRLMDDIACGAR